MIGERSLRNYVHRPPEELYDLTDDPAEVHNLADDPDYAALLAGFREELETWQQDTLDPWFYRDGISVRAVEHHMDKGLRLPNRFDLDTQDPSS
ncbi:sulfatase/phosphatase domain-containing protein [Paracoccus saliphilus]|uniref:DUF4976 domain-containing protein n=1 Tax=Paracoccus saliphilus TaxID=405559 RepID=A0AA45W7S7_9RHOB|nr:sulfatase/phosphatase domain-containing protein [Paracoccus saliphilus]WCR02781.1 DUF4976 domain-containing protein [Paracoccus saliphilus]SIT11873.1 N-sulfoglucosamine sulfohydrolase [Paracoccus saliphilus]